MVKHLKPSSRRIASDDRTDTQPRSMQFCGDLPLFINLADTLARDSIKTIDTAVTVKMVAINNRPRRRNGLKKSFPALLLAMFGF